LALFQGVWVFVMLSEAKHLVSRLWYEILRSLDSLRMTDFALLVLAEPGKFLTAY
jgi:hypothetical protein